MKVLAPGIVSKRGVMGGHPCFAGTRLPVSIVAGIARAHGAAEAIRTYPQLTEKQVAEAVAFIAANPQHKT